MTVTHLCQLQNDTMDLMVSELKKKRGEENDTNGKEAEPMDDTSTAANADIDPTNAHVDSVDEYAANNNNTTAYNGEGHHVCGFKY